MKQEVQRHKAQDNGDEALEVHVWYRTVSELSGVFVEVGFDGVEVRLVVGLSRSIFVRHPLTERAERAVGLPNGIKPSRLKVVAHLCEEE